MTIFIPLFLAVFLAVIAMLLPSFVAILAILLNDRKPTYLLVFLTTSLWVFSVALFVATWVVLPWGSFSLNMATGVGAGIFFAVLFSVVTAVIATSKMAKANYAASWPAAKVGSSSRMRTH